MTIKEISKTVWGKIVGIGVIIGIISGIYEIKGYYKSESLDNYNLSADIIDNRPRIIPEEELKLSNIRTRYFSNVTEENVFDTIIMVSNPPKNVEYKLDNKYFFNKDQSIKSNKPKPQMFTEYTVDASLEIKNTGKRKAIYQGFIIGNMHKTLETQRNLYLNEVERKKSVKNMSGFSLLSDLTFFELNPGDSGTVWVRNHTLQIEDNGDFVIHAIVIYSDELDYYFDTYVTSVFSIKEYRIAAIPNYTIINEKYARLSNIEYFPEISNDQLFHFINQKVSNRYIYTMEEKKILKSMQLNH